MKKVKLGAIVSALAIAVVGVVTLPNSAANAATGTITITAYSSVDGTVAATTTLTNPTDGACYTINQPSGSALAWGAVSSLDRAVKVFSTTTCTAGSWLPVLPSVPANVSAASPKSVRIGV